MATFPPHSLDVTWRTTVLALDHARFDTAQIEQPADGRIVAHTLRMVIRDGNNRRHYGAPLRKGVRFFPARPSAKIWN